ncbi:MAG: hypothetical protein ACE5EU_02845 [Paracoccaceae bacterium]
MTRRPIILASLLALSLTGVASEAAARPKSINSCTTITKPGAYVVARNINGSAAAGDCIVIDQSHVTLNLGGMVIAGPGAFGGIAGGHGVHVIGTNSNVEVRNGTVVGWTSGVVADPSVVGIIVERVRAIDNAGVGINVLGDDAILTRNYATLNDNFGILFGSGALVMRNVTNGNTGGTGAGMQGECDSVVMFNTSVGNSGTDLSITGSAVDVNCVVKDNATTSP